MSVDLDPQTQGSQGRLGATGAQPSCSSGAMGNLSEVGTEVGGPVGGCCSCPVRNRVDQLSGRVSGSAVG